MILVVNWFELQLIWLSIALRFKWFGCQSMCASNDFGCLLIWTSSDVVINWFEIQVIRLSIDLRFKWFGCQSVWDSNELVVNWIEIQVIWMSNDLGFKWFGCQLMCDSNDFVKRSFSARLPSKLKPWSSKTKLFCETSFKIEALKIKNQAFLRDFLQNWSLKRKAFLRDFLQKCNFEAPKRSISARLPSKLKLWSSKNKAFLRDFLQKWNFEAPKRSISARLPSKMKRWSSKTKLFCETSFKNDMSTRHLTSELQYVLAIFNLMLQKYCACHEKVEPRHTKSCNCHAKWSLQSNTSVTWNLQPFHGFSVECFKHRHHKPQNPCACHAKRIVSEPLQIYHACQRFCDPDKLLRLPRILQPVEIPAPATRNTLSTSKNVPSPWCFNDFDFQIVRARRRGANFGKLNFQKCSEHAAWCLFFVKIALPRRRGAILAKLNFKKRSEPTVF